MLTTILLTILVLLVAALHAHLPLDPRKLYVYGWCRRAGAGHEAALITVDAVFTLHPYSWRQAWRRFQHSHSMRPVLLPGDHWPRTFTWVQLQHHRRRFGEPLGSYQPRV